MQVRLIRLITKIEYLTMPKGTKFKGSGKLRFSLKELFKSIFQQNQLILQYPREND